MRQRRVTGGVTGLDFIGYVKRRREPRYPKMTARTAGRQNAQVSFPAKDSPELQRQTHFATVFLPASHGHAVASKPAADLYYFLPKIDSVGGFGSRFLNVLAPTRLAWVPDGRLTPIGPSPNIRRPRPASYGAQFELR